MQLGGDRTSSEETAIAPSPRRRVLHAAAFSIGVVAAALAGVLQMTVTSHPVPADATVSIEAGSNGNLLVSPAGVVASDTTLAPGDGQLRVTLRLTNQTATATSFVLGAEVGDGTLDDRLLIRASAGGAQLFDGPLADLRAGNAGSFLLEPGASTEVEFSAAFPESLTDGYQGVEETVRLTFDAEASR